MWNFDFLFEFQVLNVFILFNNRTRNFLIAPRKEREAKMVPKRSLIYFLCVIMPLIQPYHGRSITVIGQGIRTVWKPRMATWISTFSLGFQLWFFALVGMYFVWFIYSSSIQHTSAHLFWVCHPKLRSYIQLQRLNVQIPKPMLKFRWPS